VLPLLGALCAPAAAQDLMRIPTFSYETDGEIGPITRTGFILSPTFSIGDEFKVGGTGDAVLQDVEGWAIGGKVGYDYQFDSIVIGAITDLYWSFANGNGEGAGAGIFKSDMNYYGTVRGRLGYACGRWLPYLTAGYAYGSLEISNGVTGVSNTETLSGWTYGGGLEFVWNRELTLHVGYRRIDFGDQTYAALPVGQETISPSLNVWDFGLVHRF
jgi:outer membrane immunogenic protein